MINSNTDLDFTYTYDDIYQVLTATAAGTAFDEALTYDPAGNRLSWTWAGSTDSYTTANSLNQYPAVGGVDLTYDDNGNLILVDDGLNAAEYDYDSENQLLAAGDNLYAAEYYYDPLGQRSRKYVTGLGATDIVYCYDGPNVIAEYAGSGIARKFVYAPGIDEPLMMIIPGETAPAEYCYVRDGLGSVVALTDADANIVETYTYTNIHGAFIVNTNPGTDYDWFTPDGGTASYSTVGNPFYFTSRAYDRESGLYYYRARYYSPDLGRFLQPDPIGFAAGFNIYSYCGNDPLNWFDPLGLRRGWYNPVGWWYWMYTGYRDPPSPQVYNAALDGAAEFLLDSSPIRGGYAGVGLEYKGVGFAGVGQWMMVDHLVLVVVRQIN